MNNHVIGILLISPILILIAWHFAFVFVVSRTERVRKVRDSHDYGASG